MSNHSDTHRVDILCQLIAAGRTAARQLASALKSHQVREGEFRLLWLLRCVWQTSNLPDSPSQTELAAQLGQSTAQVSATVEQLRAQGVIAPIHSAGDRRCQAWELTPAGSALVEKIAKQVESQVDELNLPGGTAWLLPLFSQEAA